MPQIREAILASSGLASFQPPELLFGDTRDIEQFLRALPQEVPAPAGT